MALTPEQAAVWDLQGAVTVRTPLADDPALLQRCQAAMLRGMPWYHDNAGNPIDRPGRVTNTNALTEREPALADVVQVII